MSRASDHLRQLRVAAGYHSARTAALAMGVPVATYSQHENARRHLSITQNERYLIFFHAKKLTNGFTAQALDPPPPEVLAALVYDKINGRRIWAEADEETAQAYLEGVQAALGLERRDLPEKPPSPSSGSPEAS